MTVPLVKPKVINHGPVVLMTTKKAYKLFRIRSDGSIGSLFINAKARYDLNVWIDAERKHKKQGFQYRPGWHSMEEPKAPHLSIKGRRWFKVEISDFSIENRPASQGSKWYLSQRIKILRPLTQKELTKTINYESRCKDHNVLGV